MDERNSRLIDEVWDWLRKVYSAYKENTLPERTFTEIPFFFAAIDFACVASHAGVLIFEGV